MANTLSSGHSKEYYDIREEINKDWPEWKREIYNKLYATSRHAIQLEGEKKLVYLVTSGEYDEYSVDSIFSNKDKAQRYCDKMNLLNSGEDYVIEPMEFSDGDSKKLEFPKFLYVTGIFSKQGKLTFMSLQEVLTEKLISIDKIDFRYMPEYTRMGRDGDIVASGYIETTSLENSSQIRKYTQKVVDDSYKTY